MICGPGMTELAENHPRDDSKSSFNLSIRSYSFFNETTKSTVLYSIADDFFLRRSSVMFRNRQVGIPNRVLKCEVRCVFEEEHHRTDLVSVWRRESMLQAGKNYLLRMCNNLLRRLSTSRNTVLCGRIHLFLAHLLPLDEKSALNIMGAFNLDNITIFGNEAPEEKTTDDKAM